VHDADGVIAIDAWFEGRLTTRVRFEASDGGSRSER
jgi:hypothetical protein